MILEQDTTLYSLGPSLVLLEKPNQLLPTLKKHIRVKKKEKCLFNFICIILLKNELMMKIRHGEKLILNINFDVSNS